jgi:hypothetical protein
MRYYVLIALLLWLPAPAHAGNRISTFMEGTLVEKSFDQWVIETKEGTYWIKLTRPLSWIRRQTPTKISFWVRIDQITRFRPVKTLSAAAEAR